MDIHHYRGNKTNQDTFREMNNLLKKSHRRYLSAVEKSWFDYNDVVININTQQKYIFLEYCGMLRHLCHVRKYASRDAVSELELIKNLKEVY